MTLLELAGWIAALVMFAGFLIEALISKYLVRDGHYDATDTFVSIAIMIGYVLMRVGIGAVSTVALIALWSVTPLRWSMQWWHWIVLFLVVDFLNYWSHRGGHVIELLWASHVVHHNSPKLNLSTGMRNSWIGVLYDWMFFIPAVALGFHPLCLAAVVAVGSAWDFMTHTPYVGRLRWFDGWANTPSNHRVHHGRNPRYVNKNFGGALIIWDRMFGTYQPERDDEPANYGVHPMPARPNNPFYLELYLWIAVLRRVLSRRRRRPPARARRAPWPRHATIGASVGSKDVNVPTEVVTVQTCSTRSTRSNGGPAVKLVPTGSPGRKPTRPSSSAA